MRRALAILALVLWPAAMPLWAGGFLETAQQTLKDQGFYNGPIDGQKNEQTVAAIRRYQIRNGLAVTGELDVDTQRALGVTGAPPPRPTATPPPGGFRDATTLQPNEPANTPTPAPPVEEASAGISEEPPPPSRPVSPIIDGIFLGTPYQDAPPSVQQRIIAGAQYQLMRERFYRGGVDGIYGPATASALRNFQSARRLSPTGRFDVRTLQALDLLSGERRVLPRRSVMPRVYRGEWIRE